MAKPAPDGAPPLPPDLPPELAQSGWGDLAFFRRSWPGLARRLAAEAQAGAQLLPPPDQRFRALTLTPPEAVRVVILGQDPYPTPGHANGLAFSVAPGQRLPRSLANIYAELRADLGACPPDGDLAPWARQGVLLLNSALSVAAGAPGSHARWGWQDLVQEVLARAAARRPLALILWGAHAQGLAQGLAPPPAGAHLRLASAHPSPLSARRGFFGSRPFSQVNAWLQARGEAPIVWA